MALALRYLNSSGQADPAVVKDANEKLERGTVEFFFVFVGWLSVLFYLR